MYINATGYYVPEGRVDNDHFLEVNGLTSDWIYKRTGIKTRSKAGEGEGHNSMGLAAIADAVKHLPYDIKDVDLIVSASYSPLRHRGYPRSHSATRIRHNQRSRHICIGRMLIICQRS